MVSVWCTCTKGLSVRLAWVSWRLLVDLDGKSCTMPFGQEDTKQGRANLVTRLFCCENPWHRYSNEWNPRIKDARVPFCTAGDLLATPKLYCERSPCQSSTCMRMGLGNTGAKNPTQTLAGRPEPSPNNHRNCLPNRKCRNAAVRRSSFVCQRFVLAYCMNIDSGPAFGILAGVSSSQPLP